MKKHLHLLLLLLAFTGIANAQLTVINPIDLPIKMAFDMMTGELFGAHYGNLYQLDPNTGAYTVIGPLYDGSNSYDPTCLFMAYGSNPTEFTVGDLNYHVNDDNVSVTVTGHANGYDYHKPWPSGYGFYTIVNIDKER